MQWMKLAQCVGGATIWGLCSATVMDFIAEDDEAAKLPRPVKMGLVAASPVTVSVGLPVLLIGATADVLINFRTRLKKFMS